MLRGNLNDLELRQVLTVAVGAVIALALLELKDEDLLALELLDDLRGDGLALEGGGTNDGLGAVVHEKDRELDLLARLRVELLDVDDVALGNLILLATLYCLPPVATIAYMCETLHCWLNATVAYITSTASARQRKSCRDLRLP